MNKEFIQKVLAVQAALKAPKSQYNSFGKYNYRSAEDILEAAKPLLAKQGLLLTLADSIETVGNRFYVKVGACLTDGENVISASAYAREDETEKGKTGSQITGTASSYARKYALNGLFLIDDTKDPDTNAYKQEQQAHEQQEPQQDYMANVCDWWRVYVPLFLDQQEALSELLSAIGASDMKHLTQEQAERAVLHMSQKYYGAQNGC